MKQNDNTILLDRAEHGLRLERVRSCMRACAADGGCNVPDGLLISNYANIYYLTGRVFAGMVYVPLEGEAICLVQRPVHIEGDTTVHIRKPEDLAGILGDNMPRCIGLELAGSSWNKIERLKRIFPGVAVVDASAVMRQTRAVKTDVEVDLLRQSGVHHVMVYSRIPGLFCPAMTDLELQIEIERLSRQEGCIGQFRISGDTMELFMGNVTTGENADAPSPYDFAMGGAGADPSLPVGACGEEIKPGYAVMVDMNGNYTGYMTDMTRVYSLGDLPELALKAHQCSIDIHQAVCAAARPGTEAKALWELSMENVERAGLADYYMGHRQKAGFVGHGVGIEINEAPVLAPRSRDVLQAGNVIAIEPKFVIPGVGAVGIENTYVVRTDGLECLTPAPEEIISLG